jgi:regulator of sigma E protease
VDPRTNDNNDQPHLNAAAATAEESPSSWLAQHGVTLAILVAFLAFFIYRGIDLTVVGFIVLGLGFVIFIHEMGHFLAAKWCDVNVETFSIGFGPSLPYCHYKLGETTYKIGLIPLGGYVKMLGEGSESEDGEDDPRSFKNKTVGQRMLIISAGVIMNMLFAMIGFIGIYMGPGTDRIAGVVGQVDPGSPAWQAGLPSGALLTNVNGMDDPFFDQIKPTIALAGKNVSIPMTFLPPGSSSVEHLDIEPRYEAEKVGQKLIGISPATTTRIRGLPRLKIPPYVANSAAAQADPPLQHGDVIVATTNPADPAGALLALPRDPRNPHVDRPDFFELHRRMVKLVGQPIKLRVERTIQEKGQPDRKEIIESTVPAAFVRDLGLIMKMGPVFAVRNDSPAAKAGVQSKIASKDKEGDIIESVEVADTNGGIIRFTNARSKTHVPGVTEKPLDPVRLPFDLEQWAASAQEPKTVTMTVMRPSGHAQRSKEKITLNWDDSWKFSRESPLSLRSPLSIPGLGLAYRIETQVEDVVPGSVADSAGVKPGDVVKQGRWFQDVDLKDGEKFDLAADEWAFVATMWQERVNNKQLDLWLQRSGANQLVEVSLKPTTDAWPTVGRGFRFDDDMRHQHAETPMQAIAMGSQRVADTAKNVYISLQRMIDGGISFWKNANGPIAIAVTSYNVAAESLVQFFLLLCVLSVNLAVLNFLPIPLLDGGHMVFLLYEKARGKPMPEAVRTTAGFAGMALLLSLMACVFFLDIWKIVK